MGKITKINLWGLDSCITFAALKTTIYAPIGCRFQIFTGERISKKKVK